MPPTQTSLEDGFFTNIDPCPCWLTSEEPVEFCIAGESSNYINLANNFLHVRVSVTQTDGTGLGQDVEIAPECNFLPAFWSNCDLYLNDTLVTQSNNNYSYRSYTETLLSFGKDAKNSQLSSVLWYRNTAGAFNARGANNAGYTKQKPIAAENLKYWFGWLKILLIDQSQYY